MLRELRSVPGWAVFLISLGNHFAVCSLATWRQTLKHYTIDWDAVSGDISPEEAGILSEKCPLIVMQSYSLEIYGATTVTLLRTSKNFMLIAEVHHN